MIEKQEKSGGQDRYNILSIEKAFHVIETLAEHSSLSLIELTDALKQPKSSLYRIIQTLESLGYVTRDDQDGKYCLGYKNLVITKNIIEKSSIRNAAVPEMQKLVDAYGDTANLGVLSNGDVLYLEIIEGTNALRMTDTVGSRAPIHATAMGKAIAAWMGESELRAWLRTADFAPMTSRTIADPDAFVAELRRVRDQGFALDDQEIVEGARCVAAPVFDMFGKTAGALSLSGALHRFSDDRLPGIANDVRAAAAGVSRKLGYAGPGAQPR